jgi:hypothetical protein
MNAQRANEIEVLLEGVPLPASRDMLVQYAASQDGDAAALLQEQLPDREYDRLDLVGELLLGAETPPAPPPSPPVAESGKPPGGDDYVRPFAQPGAVRQSAPKSNPPSSALEQQSKTQKKQQAKQEG